MARALATLKGMPLSATDGSVGEITELFFDDRYWIVRYLVVRIGEEMAEHRVIVPRELLEEPIDGVVPVAVAREAIVRSPGIDADMPVSRRHEIDLMRYYGLSGYWLIAGGGSFNDHTFVSPPPPAQEAELKRAAKTEKGKIELDDGRLGTHLRRTEEVLRYRAFLANYAVGRAQDLIIDDRAWMVEALQIMSGQFFWRRCVDVPVKRVREISWIRSRITLEALS
jgi:hypothetical protein